MVLESLDSETPNIKDLSVEEQPKSEISIDFEKIIDEEFWQDFIDSVDSMELEREEDLLVCFDNASKMMLLNPERMGRYLQNLPETVLLEPLKGHLHYRVEPLEFDSDDAEVIVNAKILFPQKAHELYSQDAQEYIKDYLIGLKRSSVKHFYRTIAFYKILFPDVNIITEFMISNDELKAIDLEIVEDLKQGYLDTAIMKAQDIRLAIPEHSFRKYFSKEDGKKLIAELDSLRDKLDFQLLELAVAVKCLLARNIEITDDGIQFGPLETIGTAETPSTPQIPMPRNF